MLATEWLTWGLEYLQSLGFEEDLHYRNKAFKPRLFGSIALVFWNALVRHAETHADLTIEDLAQRLDVAPSTLNRWINGKVQPSSEKFFVTMVLVLKQGIHEVDFPTQPAVIWIAVARTLELIRQEDCKREPRRISRAEFLAVRAVIGHPQSSRIVRLVSGLGEESDVMAGDQGLLRDALSSHAQLAGWTESQVCEALAEWLRPYLLLRIGVLDQWEFLNEDAA